MWNHVELCGTVWNCVWNRLELFGSIWEFRFRLLEQAPDYSAGWNCLEVPRGFLFRRLEIAYDYSVASHRSPNAIPHVPSHPPTQIRSLPQTLHPCLPPQSKYYIRRSHPSLPPSSKDYRRRRIPASRPNPTTTPDDHPNLPS